LPKDNFFKTKIQNNRSNVPPANYLLIVVNLAGGAQVLCRVLEVAEQSLRSTAELVRRGVVRIQLNGS
jgi:hypothetical protein